MAITPPSDIIRTLLTTHIGVSGWVLETGMMPNAPDRVIMLTDTQGPASNPKFLLDFPTVQVMVRGNSSGYLAAWTEADAVKDLLLGVDPYTTGGGERVVSITQNGDLGFIGRDDDMRPMFALNFALITEPPLVANSNRIAL